MKVHLNPRRSDQDRYSLTPLAVALLEDPLETWLTLEKDADYKLDPPDAEIIEFDGRRAA